MKTIELRSPAFSDHASVPARYARDGENVSPPLEWSGVPDGAAELALICEDPDAPGGTSFFRLFAVSEPLGLAPGISVQQLRDAMDGRELGRGTLVGTYQR